MKVVIGQISAHRVMVSCAGGPCVPSFLIVHCGLFGLLVEAVIIAPSAQSIIIGVMVVLLGGVGLLVVWVVY